MKISNLGGFAVTCAALAFTTCACADSIAFDTLGAQNTYATDQGMAVGGGSYAGPTGANYVQAMKFTAGATGTLKSVDTVFWRLQGSTDLSFSILSDANGTPGAVLASVHVSDGDQAALLTGNYAGDVAITANTTYWFSVSTDDLAGAHWWAQNDQQIYGDTAFAGALWQSAGQWFYQHQRTAAFRVNLASPVPESSTALLMIGGLLSLSALGSDRHLRRTRSRGAP